MYVPRHFFAAAVLTISSVSLARAGTLVVSTNADSGAGSLRAAIGAANASAGDDRIVFTAGATQIALTGALPVITDGVTVVGLAMGPTATPVEVAKAGSGKFSLLSIASGVKADIGYLRLRAGSAENGGAINNSGQLTLTKCTLSASQATNGGALFNAAGAQAKIALCNFADNDALHGGAITNFGQLTLRTSTLEGNAGTGDNSQGGALYNCGEALLDASTLNDNAARQGGAIYSNTNANLSVDGTRLTNCTLTGNSAGNGGGGLFIKNGVADLDSVTVSSNLAPANAGAGVQAEPTGRTRIFLRNNIIAANLVNDSTRSSNVDFSLGTSPNTEIVSRGNNLLGDSNQPFPGVGNDFLNTLDSVVLLGALTDNGGPTLTRMPLRGSMAINFGRTNLTVDQVGRPRLPTDIGAVEYSPTPVAYSNFVYGRVGESFSAYLPLDGNDRRGISAKIVKGTLPDGLTLNPQTLEISGVPTSITQGQTIQIQLTDGYLESNIGLLTLYIAEPRSLVVNSEIDSLDIHAGDYDGRTNLREAIEYANSSSDVSAITFDLPPGKRTVALLGELPLLSFPCSIVGPSSDKGVVITRSDTVGFAELRLLRGNSDVYLANLTFTGGVSYGFSAGGVSNYGLMTMFNCTVAGNTGTSGGGIFNYQEFFTPNYLKLLNCTISGNVADVGGGIYNASGNLLFDSCTIVGNKALAGKAAGVWMNADFDARITIENSIIAGNLTKDTTVLSNLDIDGNPGVGFISKGHNLVGDGRWAPYFTDPTDWIKVADADLKVAPLADNGGPAPTMALLLGSPALDKGVNSLGVDERGLPRGYGGAADIGAYERQQNEPPVVSGITFNPVAPRAGQDIEAVVTATDPDGTTPQLTYVWTRTRRGQTVTLSDSDATLSSPETMVGDLIMVSVVASDGLDESQPLSASVTIVNAPISIESLALKPRTPYTTDKMMVSVKTVDPDKTPAFYSYSWTKNGVLTQQVTHSRSAENFYNLSLSGKGDKGDIIEVTVVVSDGGSTATAQASATVLNSVPVLTQLVLTPKAPIPGQTVVSTYTGQDADNDALPPIYSWKIGKKVLAQEKDATLDLSKYPLVKAGDVISLSMRLSDGEALSRTRITQVTVATPPAAVSAPLTSSGTSGNAS